MPKASGKVIGTDREVRAATSAASKTDFRIRGAQGLLLRVTEAGNKSWALVYKSPATGGWTKASLGTYPSLGLAEAKGLALDMVGEVRKGRDPVHDKRQREQMGTFALLAERYMREHEKRNARDGKASRSTREAQRQLDRDINPRLGKIRADAVTRYQVMDVIEEIADRGSYVAADRALGLVRAIYNWACGTGRLELNPTLGLKKRNTARAQSRVLSHDEIRSLWLAMDTVKGITPPIRDALRLQLLTGARINEVAGTPRGEIDLAARVWTIAANRTKAEREHVLPLSPAAAELFAAAIKRADVDWRRRAGRLGLPLEPSPWVFPSAVTGGPIDGHAATRCIVRTRNGLASAGLTEPFNTHDLRRTLATQLGELGIADELIERILNHSPRSVAGKHYNHASYLQPMRRALDAWAERLTVIVAGQQVSGGNVVRLHGAGGGA